MSRPVAGLACKIRMTVRHYQAVAIVVGEGSHSVRLMHREAGLCVDLAFHPTFAAAEDHRDHLAAYLDLPPLMLAGRGAAATEPAIEPTRRRVATAKLVGPGS